MQPRDDTTRPVVCELDEQRSRDPSAFAAVIADLLVSGTAVKFTASGRSMRPAIHAGDRLTVIPRGDRALRRGDVALYRRPGGLTAHRVLAFSGEGARPCIRVRGDASRGVIDEIPAGDVLGIVALVERHSRVFRVDTSIRRVAGLLRAAVGTWRVRLGRWARGGKRRE